MWGEDGRMLAKFFFCVFIDGDEVEKDWSIKDLLLYRKKREFLAALQDQRRKTRAHLARWGSQSERPLVNSAM